jgi:hypothetical protein
MLQLRQLNLGKVDGRAEYLEPKNERDESFYDAFLVPDSVDVSRLHNSDLFYVEGFRGTGKTSLLRWFAENRRRQGAVTDFVLFKSDVPEERRLGLSTEVGVTWVDTDTKRMELSQDFKSAWSWFLHHKIGEMLRDAPIRTHSGAEQRYLRLLSLNGEAAFSKVLGFLPKLEGAKISIKADFAFFEAELEGDFIKEGGAAKTTLDALNRKLFATLKDIDFSSDFYIFFDELEVFHETNEKYVRDQRMVRDLLFVIDRFNNFFRSNEKPLHVIGAVRSEVVDAFGATGQEVDRVVHDHSVMIAWHFARRSLDHPLIEMVRRKMQASEAAAKMFLQGDPISRYFPGFIQEASIDAFLLDRSFYKPRDLVWRLTIAQKQFPLEKRFTEQILRDSEKEYSSKLWEEIRYELSASYSSSEIDAMEMGISGGSVVFDLPSISLKFERAQEFSQNIKTLMSKHGIAQVLSDLYRLGAIGNRYRSGTSGSDLKQRWAFRGDIGLMLDQQMTIHPGLIKRLSASPSRKRSRPGGKQRARE